MDSAARRLDPKPAPLNVNAANYQTRDMHSAARTNHPVRRNLGSTHLVLPDVSDCRSAWT